MSPSRGYSGGRGGYPYGYSGNWYANPYANAYSGSTNSYGNAYSDYSYNEGNHGYSHYEHHQQYPHVEQHRSQQYQAENNQQDNYYHQPYPQRYSQQQYSHQHSQYHDTYSDSTQNPPRRRASPSYDDYDVSSAARAQSSRGYSTYSSSRSSSSPRRSDPSRRPNSPSEILLMPPLSMSTELLASRGTSRSPRRRSASPPPPRRTEPREEYLRLSQEPSSYIDAPEKARKLIVLDLNGSLLLRSAHQRRLPTPRQAPHSQDQSTDPYADPTVLRPLRVVHPRPYLSSFITYILHPKTKQWLDTMVWSSAQPHSVNDMVDKCFKERRQELKAVWARDTLGLTNNEYHRKTLTLKDLEKPWAELPLVSSNEPKPPSDRPPPPTSSSPTSHSVSLPNGAAESDPPATTSQTTHSARTTLLIDDSPLKAALQPWNHLVIPEYVQEMRNKDLKVAELVRERETVQDRITEQSEDKETGATVSEDLTDEIKAEASSQPLSDTVPAPAEINAPSAASDSHLETPAADNGSDATVDTQSNRALKRLQKKEAGKLKRAEEHAKRISEVVGDQKFDQTLLAVIGILDRVKWEDNVAGWMRSGGLVNVEGVNVHHVTGETSVKDVGVPTMQSVTDLENEREEETSKRPLSHTPPTRSRDASASPSPDDGTIPGSGSKKRRRVSDQAENLSTVEQPALDTGMDTSVDGAASQPNEATSTDISLAQMQSAQAQPDDQEKVEEEKAEQSATGIPVISSPNSMLVPQPPNPLCDDDGAQEQSTSLKLWYEYPEVLAFWAERGQRALGELGIEVTSGILLNESARRKVST